MVLAVSGKCCSGKNHITGIMEVYGFESIDVDLVSADIFKNSTEAIISIFGSEVLENGVVNRAKVGDQLFADKSKRAALESIIHPLTYEHIYNIIDKNPTGDYIINIPILKEMGLIERCNAIIWVQSPLLLRIYRALKRDNYTIITVLRRIMAQKKLSIKHLNSTVDKYCINNSWYSIGLERDISAVLKRLGRG